MDEFETQLASLSETALDDLFALASGGDLLTEGATLEAGALNGEQLVVQVSEEIGETEETNKLGSQRSNKRKARNAERCRRYRARRQREAAELVRDNAAMREERRILQHQLSSLQREVTQLMLSQQVDLQAENDVLRKQLMTYEAYVDRVVSAVNAPLWLECTTTHEQARAIQSVLDSAVNRLVGIMYNSMTDASWKHGKPFKVEDGIYVRWMFQLLPRGSSLHNATHANLRFDVKGLPFSPETLAEYSWKYLKRPPGPMDPGMPSDTPSKRYWYNHAQVEEVETPKLASVDGPLECTRIVYPVRLVEKEVVLLHSTKDVQVYPMAYMNNAELAGLEEPVLAPAKCTMVVSTTAGGIVESNESSNRSVLGPGVFTKALALAAESDDPTLPRSKMTHLLKIGLNHESRSLWEKDYLFETDGDGVSLLVKRLMQGKIQKMMQDLG